MNFDYDLNMDHFADMAEGEKACMPISAIRIFRFLDENGDECIRYDCEGEALLPRTLGMIEWAKLDLMRCAFEPEDDT